MSIFDHVDAVVILHLTRRTDRLAHMRQELALMGLAFGMPNVHIYDGYDKPNDSGNQGCTESHRGILEVIQWNQWNRTLVLEDDFAIRKEFRDSFLDHLEYVMHDVPKDAKIVYLGGGYANDPKGRHSRHLIEVNRMMTTSSFIISREMAAEMAPHISGVGPIDVLFGGFTERGGCYCVQPRLFYQYTSKSDLTDREDDYEPSMTDSRHEEMLLEGKWMNHSPPGLSRFKGRIQRREISARNDANGSIVICDTDDGPARYVIHSIEFPNHAAPWYRDEPVVYTLRFE